MEDLFKKVPTALKAYIEDILCFKNYSFNTAKGYRSNLLCFFEFIRKYYCLEINVLDFNIFTFLSISKDDILAFLSYLSYSKNNGPNSRRRYLNSIRSFYKWLYMKYNINQENPAFDIKIMQMERLPKYLNLTEAKKINNIFNHANSRYYVRNNTIICFFINCGLRISELINIDLSDINLQDNFIKVVGKGNKERNVYLNKNIQKQLKMYLSIRTKIKANSTALFLNNANRRLGVSGIEKICSKAYKIAGIANKKYTPHTLRHTAATLMYQYGNVDIRILQKFLGHSNISSTEIYTHVINNQVKNAVESNPLSNFHAKSKRRGEKHARVRV